MAAKLVITPEVEGDIDETYAWYEQRRIGLGEEFLGSVEACIARLSRSPKMHPLIHETYRRVCCVDFRTLSFTSMRTES